MPHDRSPRVRQNKLGLNCQLFPEAEPQRPAEWAGPSSPAAPAGDSGTARMLKGARPAAPGSSPHPHGWPAVRSTPSPPSPPSLTHGVNHRTQHNWPQLTQSSILTSPGEEVPEAPATSPPAQPLERLPNSRAGTAPQPVCATA